MSQPTQSTNAITFQSDLIAAAVQFDNLLAFCQSIQERQATHNYAANLQAMPTYTLNPDGTEGEADAIPDQGNPIVGLNVSFYSLDIFRSVVVADFIKMLTGAGDVPASDHRPQIDGLLP